MQFLNGSDIEKALSETYRVYLCGNLGSPQKELQWIHDGQLEIGTSNYEEFTVDKPHFHTTATEYNYVLEGVSKVFLIDEGKEYLFEKGSLFVLPPNTKYASKHIAQTKILFIKSPGGNDKQLVEINSDIATWLEKWD